VEVIAPDGIGTVAAEGRKQKAVFSNSACTMNLARVTKKGRPD